MLYIIAGVVILLFILGALIHLAWYLLLISGVLALIILGAIVYVINKSKSS